MRESDIQTKIKKKLEKEGWLVVKIISCSKNGWPDLQVFKGARTSQPRVVFIEVKQETGKVSDLQKFRHEELRDLGFEVIVAHGLDDVKHLFDEKKV